MKKGATGSPKRLLLYVRHEWRRAFADDNHGASRVPRAGARKQTAKSRGVAVTDFFDDLFQTQARAFEQFLGVFDAQGLQVSERRHAGSSMEAAMQRAIADMQRSGQMLSGDSAAASRGDPIRYVLNQRIVKRPLQRHEWPLRGSCAIDQHDAANLARQRGAEKCSRSLPEPDASS